MTEETADTGRVTRGDLAQGRIDKVMTERTSMVPMADAGLRFENAMQMAEAAKLMATAGPMLPEWLQGNVGGCWGILLRSTELGISALTLANWTYVVENNGVKRVAYESQFYHAIIEARAPLKERLQYEIKGEGDDRTCRVWGVFKGETIVRELESARLGDLRPGKNQYGKTKGSPLWDRKPTVQMFYDTSRDWARLFCPDILGGVYARDEMEEAEDRRIGPEHAVDVSPKLIERLRGPTGEGFGQERAKEEIAASIDAARVKDKPAAKRKREGEDEQPVPAADSNAAAPAE